MSRFYYFSGTKVKDVGPTNEALETGNCVKFKTSTCKTAYLDLTYIQVSNMTVSENLYRKYNTRLDYQPLFGKGASAPPPKALLSFRGGT